MKKGEKIALARLISIVENGGAQADRVASLAFSADAKCARIGITGPPGAGKSTIVDGLIGVFRKKNRKVSVVAVDPSSPFSGGAVLGDRIRMQSHAKDAGVFIRSMGSRGAHGGLSAATRRIVELMEAYGSGVVIIETVGVGQTELDIMEIADTTAVVLVPESGDTIQTMKAGLLEIADIFVVNKSDRDGAHRMAEDLSSMVEISNEDNRGGWKPPVLMTCAKNGTGVAELARTIDSHMAFLGKRNRIELKRRSLRKRDLLELFAANARAGAERLLSSGGPAKLFRMVEEGNVSPHEAYRKLVGNRGFLAGIFKRQEEN
jgi:LAO/AO transport system kinase